MRAWFRREKQPHLRYVRTCPAANCNELVSSPSPDVYPFCPQHRSNDRNSR